MVHPTGIIIKQRRHEGVSLLLKERVIISHQGIQLFKDRDPTKLCIGCCDVSSGEDQTPCSKSSIQFTENLQCTHKRTFIQFMVQLHVCDFNAIKTQRQLINRTTKVLGECLGQGTFELVSHKWPCPVIRYCWKIYQKNKNEILLLLDAIEFIDGAPDTLTFTSSYRYIGTFQRKKFHQI